MAHLRTTASWGSQGRHGECFLLSLLFRAHLGAGHTAGFPTYLLNEVNSDLCPVGKPLLKLDPADSAHAPPFHVNGLFLELSQRVCICLEPSFLAVTFLALSVETSRSRTAAPYAFSPPVASPLPPTHPAPETALSTSTYLPGTELLPSITETPPSPGGSGTSRLW